MTTAEGWISVSVGPIHSFSFQIPDPAPLLSKRFAASFSGISSTTTEHVLSAGQEKRIQRSRSTDYFVFSIFILPLRI